MVNDLGAKPRKASILTTHPLHHRSSKTRSWGDVAAGLEHPFYRKVYETVIHTAGNEVGSTPKPCIAFSPDHHSSSGSLSPELCAASIRINHYTPADSTAEAESSVGNQYPIAHSLIYTIRWNGTWRLAVTIVMSHT